MSSIKKISAAYSLATKTLKGRLIAPYQREGVGWLLMREFSNAGHKGGFLCDEMGLGKTVQMISTILGNPDKRTLVIVPKSIVTQWAEEIDNFAPHLKVLVHDGPNRTTNPNDFLKYHVVISPYSIMVDKGKPRGDPTIMHTITWGRIIIDEGHEIRNAKSKISSSVRNLKSDIKWVVTGTPVYNSIKDFVTLCDFVGIPKSHVQGITKKIQDTYVMRRTKEDVAKFNPRLKLPPCDFDNIEMEMYPEERDFYSEVHTDSSNFVKEVFKSGNLAMHTMHILECLLRCRQAMIHPQLVVDGRAKKEEVAPDIWAGRSKKMETLLNCINEHPKEKTLIFSQFIGEMNIIHEMIAQAGFRVFRIDGSVSKEERHIQIQTFREAENGIFLIQIKAGGQGLNLQEATRVYITSPAWNPATELQAIGRSHRTGQTKKVFVKKLIYAGEDSLPSVEQSIMSLQGHKSQVCADVLNDPRLITQFPTKAKGNITIHDIKKLFSV